MSTKARNLLLSGIAVLVLFGVLALLLLTNQGTEQQNQTYTLFSKDTTAISRVEVVNSTGIFSLVRSGTSWQVQPYPDIATDATAINSSVSAVSSIIGTTLVDENPSDPGLYGLKTPSSTISLSLSDGTSFAVEVGNKAPGEYGYYARVKGQTAVYTVLMTTLSLADKTPYYYLTKVVTPASQSEAPTRIEFSGKNLAAPIILTRLETAVTDAVGYAYKYRITSPRNTLSGTDLDSKYFSTMIELTATEVISVNTTENQLKTMGLDRPSVTAKVTLDGVLYPIQVGNKTEGGYFVRLGDSKTVFLVPEDSLPWAEIALENLLPRTPFEPLINDISTMTVEGGGKTFTYRFEGTLDKDLIITAGSTKIDYANFTNFYRFIGLTKGDESAAGKTKGAILLKVTFQYRDTTRPDHVLTFYKADTRTAIMSVNGTADFTINSSYLDKILSDAAIVSNNTATSLLW